MSGIHLWAGAWLALAVAVPLIVALRISVRIDEYAAEPLPAVASISALSTLADFTPTEIAITADWQKVTVTVPRHEVTSDVTLWRKMHFDDWDTLPNPLREDALSAMWSRFEGLVSNPPRWDQMTALDWDRVPQPIRAMAFISMVQYWSGYYQVGARYGLPRGTVTRTLSAIVMAESWFEHRAIHINRRGDRDIGLGGCSEFCRRTLQRLAKSGAIDGSFEDEAFFDPWPATRAAVLWFDLMLDEADGDLDLAVRSYHRGWPLASRGEGEAYLANVTRLRHTYIRNEAESPTWAFLFERAFEPSGNRRGIRQH